MEVRSRRREWGGRKGGSLPGGDTPPHQLHQGSEIRKTIVSHLVSPSSSNPECFSLGMVGQFVVLFSCGSLFLFLLFQIIA